MALQKALTIPEYYNTELTKSRAITLASGKAPGVRIRSNLLAQTTRDKSAPDQWFDENSTTIDALGSIEKKLSEQVALRSQELRDAETRNAFVTAGLILGLLLLVLLLTVAIARSMVTPLRRLRTEALEIAGLPAAGRRAQAARSPATPPPEVQPIAIDSNDEIGEVAQGLRRGPPRGGTAGGRGGRAAWQHQRDVRQPLAPQPDAGRAADLADRRPGAGRAGRRPAGRPVQARPPGHPHAPQQREPAGPRRPGAHPQAEPAGQARRRGPRLAVGGRGLRARPGQGAPRPSPCVGSAANDLVHLLAELVENAISFSPEEHPGRWSPAAASTAAA